MNYLHKHPLWWKRLPVLLICVFITTSILTICISQLAMAQPPVPDNNNQQASLTTFESTLEKDIPSISVGTTPTTYYAYLPIVFKPFTLIINNNGDGNFVVEWESLGAGTVYTLYEDVEPTFDGPHIYPITMDTQVTVTGKTYGSYYYQVQAEKQNGEVIWSAPKMVIVTYLTIDNFEDKQLNQNTIGGPIEWFNDPNDTCVLPNPGGQDGNNAHTGNYGYRLTYAVTPTCYAAWQSSLLNKDYSDFKVVTFWIKGALGNEHPNIYLQNTSTQRCYVDVEKFLLPGHDHVTTEWQQVRIPLSEFSKCGVDLSSVFWFQIVFEWENMNGTIYIDDIKFEC